MVAKPPSARDRPVAAAPGDAVACSGIGDSFQRVSSMCGLPGCALTMRVASHVSCGFRPSGRCQRSVHARTRLRLRRPYGRSCVAPTGEQALAVRGLHRGIRPGADRRRHVRRIDNEVERRPPTPTGIGALGPARRPVDAGAGQCLSEEGDSRPSSRARVTAAARLCTSSLAYTLRMCVLIVFSDTNSSAAISGAERLVGR
jgi:hypothetical protein